MSDWRWVPSGSRVRFTRGVSWTSDQERELPTRSTHRVLRIPNIQTDLVLKDVLLVDFPGGVPDKWRATPGSIVMVGSNGNPRRVGNAIQIFPRDGNFLFASFLIAAKTRTRELNERYLFHWVRSEKTQDRISRSVQGSTGLSNLSMNFLHDLPLPLPPLEEQRRIAEILDTVDEAIQASERVIAKRLMALTGLQVHLLRTSAGARRAIIGDLVVRHWPGEWGEEGPSDGYQEVMVLRATNLNDYGIDYSTGARRFVASSKVVDKRLVDGDLLIEAAGGGPGVPVGRVRRFQQPEGDVPYVTSNFFRALRPRAGVDSDYLFWLLDNEYRKPSIWSCQQQTTGIINLNVTDYLERPVSYDEASQFATAQTLNCALEAIEAERQTLQKLRKTRSGLAADLLSGRVRTVAT